MVGLSLIYLYNFICIGVLLRNSNCFKLDSYFFLCIMRCRLLRLRKSSARCDFNLQLFSCKNVCCFCCFSLLLLFPSCNLCLVLFVFFFFFLSFAFCVLYFVFLPAISNCFFFGGMYKFVCEMSRWILRTGVSLSFVVSPDENFSNNKICRF